MEQIKELISLTGEQIMALEAMTNSTNNIFLLKGSAGVGKTTVVSEYCKRNKNVLQTAPTHKATQVLRGKAIAGVICKTTHSFLKLEQKIVGRKKIFVFDIDRVDSEFGDPLPSTLIVDEASMINSEMLEWLETSSEVYGFRIIFVGDEKQLNPVEEDESPVFHRGYESFELKEIIRHQNDIIQLSRNIPWLYGKKNGECFGWDPKINLDKLIEANGTDKAKFITWTNAVVDSVNKQVRKAIYGDPDQFEHGETILMKENYGIYKNNEEVEIFKLRKDSHYYDEVDVPFPNLDTIVLNNDMIAVTDQDMVKFNQNVEHIKQKAIYKQTSWYKYFKYKESFINYQYNHAVTVHKSQGSSYDESFVHVSDIMRNPNIKNRTRMLYTAITRAKNYNHLI